MCLQGWPPSWPWPHSVSVQETHSQKWPTPQLWTGSLPSVMPSSSRPSSSLQQSTTSPREAMPGMEKVWCQRRYLTCFHDYTYDMKRQKLWESTVAASAFKMMTNSCFLERRDSSSPSDHTRHILKFHSGIPVLKSRLFSTTGEVPT